MPDLRLPLLVDAMVDGARRCRHHACVCARAAELAEMGQLLEAIGLHHDTSVPVRCRLSAERAAKENCK